MLEEILGKVNVLLKGLQKYAEAPTKNAKARENMSNNFLKDEDKNPSEDFIARKEQSMRDSQGKSDFSGSGYNGPGNVDHEKTNSNMRQRNFEH